MTTTGYITIGGGLISIAIGVAAWLNLFHEVMDAQTSLFAGVALIVAGLAAFGIHAALNVEPPK